MKELFINTKTNELYLCVGGNVHEVVGITLKTLNNVSCLTVGIDRKKTRPIKIICKLNILS